MRGSLPIDRKRPQLRVVWICKYCSGSVEWIIQAYSASALCWFARFWNEVKWSEGTEQQSWNVVVWICFDKFGVVSINQHIYLNITTTVAGFKNTRISSTCSCYKFDKMEMLSRTWPYVFYMCSIICVLYVLVPRLKYDLPVGRFNIYSCSKDIIDGIQQKHTGLPGFIVTIHKYSAFNFRLFIPLPREKHLLGVCLLFRTRRANFSKRSALVDQYATNLFADYQAEERLRDEQRC